ncbi:MAG: hypothetical protein DME26_08380 [Verrucomicrobia bacterium]|nr:MAG: hypothetical protein DME26_08380 [Verrucomicrobiota bacterium]
MTQEIPSSKFKAQGKLQAPKFPLATTSIKLEFALSRAKPRRNLSQVLLRSWSSGVVFPLTPALSLREREKSPPPRECSQTPRHSRSLDHEQHISGDGSADLPLFPARWWLFPLPEGEGQGEGEGDMRERYCPKQARRLPYVGGHAVQKRKPREKFEEFSP